MASWLLIVAGINGFLAVALGAFGAHALKNKLSDDLRAVYQTGNQYHFYHSLSLMLIGTISTQTPENSILAWAGVMTCLGILLFSGSLYVLAVTGIRKLGAITPIGGLCFLAGWALLIYGVGVA